MGVADIVSVNGFNTGNRTDFPQYVSEGLFGVCEYSVCSLDFIYPIRISKDIINNKARHYDVAYTFRCLR